VSSIYLEFLLAYPLSEKRLNVQMDFLFKNPACPDIDAKLALVEAAKLLVERVPAAFNYDFYILVLICALANEGIEPVLVVFEGLLMQKCPDSTVRMKAPKWLEADQPGLRKVAYKVMIVMRPCGLGG
jgi:hypothetical protein